jgi:hypothetical protein
MRRRVFGEGEVIFRMPMREGRLRELLDGVLADGLQHRKSLAAVAEKALVHEGLEHVELGSGDVLCGVQRAAAAEDGEAGKQPLLVSFEQVVRPFEGRAQGLLAWIGAPPPLSRSSRCPRRSTSCSGESTRVPAAASSSASGRFSSRAHNSPTASLMAKPGSAARARARKSSLPSCGCSGGTG